MKIGYYLTLGAVISIVAMFTYDATDMIFKLGILALFLLILGGFIIIEKNMRANTDEINDTIRRDEIARLNAKDE